MLCGAKNCCLHGYFTTTTRVQFFRILEHKFVAHSEAQRYSLLVLTPWVARSLLSASLVSVYEMLEPAAINGSFILTWAEQRISIYLLLLCLQARNC